MSVLSLPRSYSCLSPFLLFTLIIHYPLRWSSDIINLNQVTTLLNVLNDLSKVLVLRGWAKHVLLLRRKFKLVLLVDVNINITQTVASSRILRQLMQEGQDNAVALVTILGSDSTHFFACSTDQRGQMPLCSTLLTLQAYFTNHF